MPHAMLRLFQTFVVPYGMYACQIWGTEYIQPSAVYKAEIQVRHLGFLRRVLGVKRTTANDCVMSEACQTPFQFYWLRSICRFWNDMCGANSEVIRDVARADVLLSSENEKCWSYQVMQALDAYPRLQGHAAESMGSMSTLDMCRVVEAWRNMYEERWHAATGDPTDPTTQHRKLCTYNAYFRGEGKRTWWQLPAYLKAGNMLHSDVVRSVARFRLCSHELCVEVGRQRHGIISRRERWCRRCAHVGVNQQQVDDERHMVFDCVATEGIRKSEDFSHLFEGVGSGDLKQFMHNNDCGGVAMFIHQCLGCVGQWEANFEGTPTDGS